MTKKRKLGSLNPRYNQDNTNKQETKKEFVHEIKGVKIYKVYYL
tara:strand:- start:256 stop:387 length:132 start_codon:yes stop_codon:yes gene_type:complete